MLRFYLALGVVAVGIGLVVGAYFYGHHKGYEEAQTSMQSKVNNANNSVDRLTGIIESTEQELEKKKKEYKHMVSMFNKSSIKLDLFRSNLRQLKSTWDTKLEALKNEPECAVLEKHICEAAMDY